MESTLAEFLLLMSMILDLGEESRAALLIATQIVESVEKKQCRVSSPYLVGFIVGVCSLAVKSTSDNILRGLEVSSCLTKVYPICTPQMIGELETLVFQVLGWNIGLVNFEIQLTTDQRIFSTFVENVFFLAAFVAEHFETQSYECIERSLSSKPTLQRKYGVVPATPRGKAVDFGLVCINSVDPDASIEISEGNECRCPVM